MNTKIRILISDDHPVIREGLATILALQNDLKVVGQARDGEEACLLYDQLSPDILILDLRMPKKDGLEVIRDLMTRIPKPWIIVMTSYESEQDIRQALSAGAEAFPVKGTGPQQIREAVTKRRQPEPDNRCLKQKGLTVNEQIAAPSVNPSAASFIQDLMPLLNNYHSMKMSTDIDQFSYVEKLATLTQLYLELTLPLHDALRAAEADL